MQIVKKLTRKLRETRSQKGFTLIEALAGTALLVIVGVAVLTGISTAFKASATTDKISNGLALAQSQMEYMQTQPYMCATNGNAAYKRIDDVSRGTAVQAMPNNYSISSVMYDTTEHQSASTDPPIVYAFSIDENGDPVLGDLGIQKIVLVVYQGGNPNPITMEGYKIKPTAEACP